MNIFAGLNNEKSFSMIYHYKQTDEETKKRQKNSIKEKH